MKFTLNRRMLQRISKYNINNRTLQCFCEGKMACVTYDHVNFMTSKGYFRFNNNRYMKKPTNVIMNI